ncbi:MAG: ABC transporter permease [Candidatus Omnitrophica bacterium]|nr:ABC transporter permease [Candidatus Omnitrophota bacterium]
MPTEKLSFDYSQPQKLQLKLSGDWKITTGFPAVDEVTAQLVSHPDIIEITFEISGISGWDSGFISFLLQLARECQSRKIRVNPVGLQPGVQKLLALALAVPKKDTLHHIIHETFLEAVGGKALQIKEGAYSLLDFLGEIAVSFLRLVTGKSYFRWDDFAYIVQKCGADALPLVSLISLLIGIILAFIGAIQLEMFGAQIFIADIVGIGMVRVMGAVMTGVLMAGRTGASFAAELGIMQVNDEIDALKTLGVSPVEFLVIPRLLALIIMMPLLTIYADLMGIVGGFVVSTRVLNINPAEYLEHTRQAIKLSNLWVGLIHSFVFGIIIAVTGCLRGIKCVRSAAGVGEATTSAVVSAITSIVVATAIITFICQILKV